jgi:hypothetical protein
VEQVMASTDASDVQTTDVSPQPVALAGGRPGLRLSSRPAGTEPPQPDRQHILAAVRHFAEPGQVLELRALAVSTPAYRRPHTVSGYYDDPEALARDAVRVAPQARGVYVTLNPLNPALLARAANRLREVDERDSLTPDTEVLRRRWLPIDVDPRRPSGVSATEAEHAAAHARALEIRAWLAGRGWPAPAYADSGNGAHLMYPIALPAADGGLVERVLKALAFRFDDAAVAVDQAVANPARIWKLYGTPVRKGDHVPERPHRLARLLEAPDPAPEASREAPA